MLFVIEDAGSIHSITSCHMCTRARTTPSSSIDRSLMRTDGSIESSASAHKRGEKRKRRSVLLRERVGGAWRRLCGMAAAALCGTAAPQCCGDEGAARPGMHGRMRCWQQDHATTIVLAARSMHDAAPSRGPSSLKARSPGPSKPASAARRLPPSMADTDSVRFCLR